MSVRNIFSHGKKLSQQRFGQKYSKDARMKEVFGDQKIAKNLDKTSERNEFYDMLKSKKEGGVTKREMKESLGEWMAGKGRTISRKEAYAVAKEFFGDEKVKYIMPKRKLDSSNCTGNSSSSGGAGITNQNFSKSSGSAASIQASSSKSTISSGELPTIYKKVPAKSASRAPKVLNSPVSSANVVSSAADGSADSIQSTQDDEEKKAERAEFARKAQSEKRRRSISAGLAAIVDMLGPVRNKDNKVTKGDFFRAINATRRNIRG